ncbi:IQ domain-containing protein E isoform X6 [Camelus ferus]|uniref:IQ domain-containing protein E isoform X6 n=1 Tax=Camelus ferus TaxID=419612 RepID=A0A8B8RCV3_CAMFR|nr:IQ domain-containing protein E isoform X6 [Camelus ferus]
MAAGARRARGLALRLRRAAGGAREADGRARSARGRSGSAAAMSLGTGEPASETGDDSLSAITFDSDPEKLSAKAKRRSFHKPPPTSPKSPYHSKPRKVASWRALRTAASMPLGSRMSLTPQKLWLGSSRQGSLTQALRSDLTLERAWTTPPSSTPDYLTEAVRMRRSNLRRSASHGSVPGTPIHREKEDMYDEIIELKKSLHMQKSDVDLMRTKLRRLEEENSRKDRQIEQLLDPSRGPDFVRTLAEKRPDTGWVINGLKQRILKLEQQCKEKDSTINKLQTDMKTTNLEEMRIAMETYYEEIHRLQTLLASSETTGKKPPVEKKIGLKKQKKMSSAFLSLSRSVQELTEENQSLKEDLDRMLSNSPTISKIKDYVEWSKPRLLRRIAELEKKMSSMESLKSHASEVVRSNPPAHSASSSVGPRQMRLDRPDRQEEGERLRGAVKSLKGERNALHTQLQERDLEVKQLLQTKADLQKELENMKEGEKERKEREEALREEIRALTKKFRELEEMKNEEEDDRVEMTPEVMNLAPSVVEVSGVLMATAAVLASFCLKIQAFHLRSPIHVAQHWAIKDRKRTLEKQVILALTHRCAELGKCAPAVGASRLPDTWRATALLPQGALPDGAPGLTKPSVTLLTSELVVSPETSLSSDTLSDPGRTPAPKPHRQTLPAGLGAGPGARQ